MATKSEIEEAFDFIANDYDNYMHRTNHANAQTKIIELLQDKISGKVLDVATGTGTIAIKLAEKNPTARITAIDISSKMIERAREKAEASGAGVNFFIDDIEQSLLPAKEFDVAICCLGMLWFADKESGLKGMARVCKNKGKIIIIEEEGLPTRSRKPKKAEAQKPVFNKNLLQFFSKIEKLETPISLEEVEKKMNELDYELTKRVKVRIDENHGFVGMVFE